MNGLAALQQTNPMAQANNPRTAAAMEVVSNEGLENLLPPATEALLNLQEATNLIASADGLLAQAGRPTTATVVEQRQQQSLDGIAAALARTQQSTPPRRPMMAQQRPPMMAQQPMRPPMQGMAGMSAPNMARMANGGVVGYAEGKSVGGEQEVNVENAAGTGSLLDKIKRFPQYQEKEGIMSGMPDFLKYIPDAVQNANFYTNEFLMPKLNALAEEDPTIRARFNKAFRSARDEGATNFTFMGNTYNTKYAEEMSGGGVVGYAEGGLNTEPSALQKVRQGVGQGMMDMGSNMQESDQIIRSKIPFIKQMLDKGPAITPQERAELKAEVEQNPGLIGMFGKQLERLGIYVKGMVGGGIVSFVTGGETGFPDLNKDGKVTYADVIKGRIGKKEGGIIGYAEGDLVIDPSMQAEADAYLLANPPPERPTYLSAEERRENLKAEEAERFARREREKLEQQQRSELRRQGIPIAALEEIMNAKPSITEFLPGNPENLPMGGTAQLTGNGTPPPPVVTTSTSPEKPDVVEEIVERISEINVEPGTSDLTDIVSEYAGDALGRDRATEEAQRRQDALDFYGMSDRERLLRQQAADAQAKALSAELDPEILRQQKIESALERLSGPGGIIGAGRRGAAARPAFDKQVRDLKRQRELAPIAAELETLGMDRAAREKAFAAGTELAKTFSAEMNTALQSLANLSNVEMSAKTSAAIQNARTSITALTTQASNELAKLREKGLNIRDNRDYQRKQDDSIATIGVNIATAIAEVNADITMDDATKQSSIRDLRAAYNVARNQIMGGGSGGGNLTPEQQAADAILGI